MGLLTSDELSALVKRTRCSASLSADKLMILHPRGRDYGYVIVSPTQNNRYTLISAYPIGEGVVCEKVFLSLSHRWARRILGANLGDILYGAPHRQREELRN